MRRLVAAACAVFICACGSSERPASSAPSSNPRASPTPIAVVTQGCAQTPVLQGGRPDWLEAAGANNNPSDVPYAIAKPAIAAGFLFGYPLRSGNPQDPANKILWVVGMPRNGSALTIAVHPVTSTSPAITVSVPPDSGPGEIYPSIVDVPSPGCWYFDLRWDGHEAGLQLYYR